LVTNQQEILTLWLNILCKTEKEQANVVRSKGKCIDEHDDDDDATWNAFTSGTPNAFEVIYRYRAIYITYLFTLTFYLGNSWVN